MKPLHIDLMVRFVKSACGDEIDLSDPGVARYVFVIRSSASTRMILSLLIRLG